VINACSRSAFSMRSPSGLKGFADDMQILRKISQRERDRDRERERKREG